MNKQNIDTLAHLKHETAFLNELLGRTDLLIGGCTQTLTELEEKGEKLDGDKLSPIVNQLDIYGAYLAEIIFSTLGRVETHLDTLIQTDRSNTDEL